MSIRVSGKVNSTTGDVGNRVQSASCVCRIDLSGHYYFVIFIEKMCLNITTHKP